MHNFRKLNVWTRSRVFARDVLRLTDAARPSDKLVTSQLRRSALAIGAQISEGCGKRTRAETIRFLDMACASAGESEHHLTQALDIAILPRRRSLHLIDEACQLQRMIHALIRNLPAEN